MINPPSLNITDTYVYKPHFYNRPLFTLRNVRRRRWYLLLGNQGQIETYELEQGNSLIDLPKYRYRYYIYEYGYYL